MLMLGYFVVAATLVGGTAASQEARTKNQEPGTELFRPESGTFPSVEKSHSYQGVLAFVDHANRRGSLRVVTTGEFFRNPVFTEHVMPDPELAFASLSPQERREAARACRGTMLRQETYALDDQPGLSEFPYSVVETALTVQQPQPLGPNRNAVFLVTPTETIS